MKGLLAKDTVVTCRQESETPFVLRSDEGLTDKHSRTERQT